MVLDTNAVLDWLVFGDPSSLAFAAAIEGGRVVWWVDASVRQELAHVVARGVGANRQPDLRALWDTWDRHGEPLRVEASALSAALPRCTDPDDQKFIELAIAGRARWLITRDRALLRLARAARRWQLEIVTPERFSLDAPA